MLCFVFGQVCSRRCWRWIDVHIKIMSSRYSRSMWLCGSMKAVINHLSYWSDSHVKMYIPPSSANMRFFWYNLHLMALDEYVHFFLWCSNKLCSLTYFKIISFRDILRFFVYLESKSESSSLDDFLQVCLRKCHCKIDGLRIEIVKLCKSKNQPHNQYDDKGVYHSFP